MTPVRDTISVREAYLAMYAFLQRRYEDGHGDELGALLGGMSLLPDGGTADPALWGDWLDGVARVKRGEIDAALRWSKEMRQ